MEYVEMPGVTAIWSAAMRVAEHMGILKEDSRYFLSTSMSTADFIHEDDIAAEWNGQPLYLIYTYE